MSDQPPTEGDSPDLPPDATASLFDLLETSNFGEHPYFEFVNAFDKRFLNSDVGRFKQYSSAGGRLILACLMNCDARYAFGESFQRKYIDLLNEADAIASDALNKRRIPERFFNSVQNVS